MSILRILLADDHLMIRIGLRMLIGSQSDMEIVGEVSTGREMIAQAKVCRPVIVITEIYLPDMGGTEVTHVVRMQRPSVQVLAYSRYRDRYHVLSMLQAGAAGYVLKSSDPNILLNAIRSLAGGARYLDPLCAGDLLAEVANPSSAHTSERQLGQIVLTPSERQVLHLFAWGYSAREIAGELGIGVKTVEWHKATALKKLRLRGRADLILYAVSKGWFHPNQEPRVGLGKADSPSPSQCLEDFGES